jgi:hypothetical protein
MKNSFIGFVKKEWKSVKFDRDIHTDDFIDEDVKYIKLAYGPTEDPEYHSPVIGKVIKIHEKGLEVVTDFGYMFPVWDRVKCIFLPKESKRINVTNVKSARFKPNSLAGKFDAAIDKVTKKIRIKFPTVKIQDNRIDLSTRYSREVKFFVGHKNVFLTVKDVEAQWIDITGTALKRQSKIKLSSKEGRVTPMQIRNTWLKIAEMVKK